MSQQDVDLVMQWFERFAQGEVAVELCTPDVRIYNFDEAFLGGPYEGHDGARRWWNDIDEALEDFRIHIEDTVDLGDGRVLTFQHMTGRFRITGIDLDAPWASIVSTRDGRISQAVGYNSRRAALRDAGLRP